MQAPREIVVNGRFLSQRTTGVQRVSREILAALDRLCSTADPQSPAIRCVVPDRRAAAAFRQLGCRNVRLELAPGLRGHFWEQFALPRHVRGGHLLCLGNTAPLASLLSPGAAAVMLHDQAHLLYPADYSAAYRAWHRVLDAVILRRAAPLLLVSEAERASLATRHPQVAAAAVVAPNGSWMGEASAPAGCIPAETRRCGLFVGAPGTRKNIDAVLAVAVRLARERRTPFRFVGPGVEALKARVPAELWSLVRFSGYVADGKLPDLYRRAAFLLYPSFYEASGLPPSEAMTFGCPVIASDLPVMRERCGDAALYCDPHDAATIHDAAVQVLTDAALARMLGRRGRAHARQFTWDRQARIIVEALCRPDAATRPAVDLSQLAAD